MHAPQSPEPRPETRLETGKATAAAPDAAGPLFDREMLDANTMSDPALQAELFDLFFGSAPGHLGAIRAAIETGDAQAWRAGAHALKGTAKTLGLMALAETARRSEAAAAERPAALADALDRAVADARRAAYAYVASVGAKR